MNGHASIIDDMTPAQLHEMQIAEGEPERIRKEKEAERLTLLAQERERQLLEKIPPGLTLRELLAADYPEPKWTADGLIPEGLTTWAGAPKVGKSWGALGLAVAVSCGGRFLGEIPVQRRRVLLLALEDSERRLADRFKMLGAAPNDDLIIRTRWEWGLAGLRAEVKRTGAELVIVDTLQKWRGFNGEPDTYARDYAEIGELQTFAIEHRLGLIVIHHTRKMGHEDPLATVSGTYGITGSADTILVLRKSTKFEGSELIVRGRDVEPQEIALRFDEHIGWVMMGDAAVVGLSDERQAILELLRDEGQPMTPASIGAELGRADTGLRMMLRRMVKDNEIVKVKRGLYALPEKGVTSVTRLQGEGAGQ